MNDFNQEQRNEQIPAPGGEPNVKQENVYTVGAGYGQQTDPAAAAVRSGHHSLCSDSVR